ncbi:MAG: hypothetical protein OXI72_00015 [Gemmatimonadota bacterium]|nr:hypothetical protein [Gemmatimonadota bacterium]
MTGRDLEAEVSALNALVGSILLTLYKRDPDLVREIINNLDVIPREDGNVTLIDPFLRSLQVALDNLTNEFRTRSGDT